MEESGLTTEERGPSPGILTSLRRSKVQRNYYIVQKKTLKINSSQSFLSHQMTPKMNKLFTVLVPFAY